MLIVMIYALGATVWANRILVGNGSGAHAAMVLVLEMNYLRHWLNRLD